MNFCPKNFKLSSILGYSEMVLLLFVILTFSSALLRYAPGSFYGLVIWGWWWIWWWWRWWHRHEVRRYNLVISQCIVRPKNVSSSYFWAYPVSLWDPCNNIVLQKCDRHWWDGARWDLLGPHYQLSSKYILKLKQIHFPSEINALGPAGPPIHMWLKS